jgi:amino acid transporter
MNCAKLSSRMEDVKTYGNTSEAQAEIYDRSHPRYPYKSHGQWLKACYGMVACTILVLFNGIGPFLERPFDLHLFIASYISVSYFEIQNVAAGQKLIRLNQVPVFVLLILGYKIRKHGFEVSRWGPERSNDLRNAIQAGSAVRKGRLELPDEGFTKQNGKSFLNWIWVWMK